jgi:hypothetical protein
VHKKESMGEVVGGIVSGLLISFGSLSLYIAKKNDDQGKQVAKLPSSTLREASKTAPSRTPYKFPKVKIVSEVKEDCQIEITQKWKDRGNGNWESYRDEQVLVKHRGGDLLLADDDDGKDAVVVKVDGEHVRDNLFEIVQDHFEPAGDEKPSVDFSLNIGVPTSNGYVSASIGNDRRPRKIGYRTVKKVIRPGKKAFAAGALNKVDNEGTPVLSASPQEKLFALSLGSEDDYLDENSTSTGVLRKIGIGLIGFGALTLAGTILLSWASSDSAAGEGYSHRRQRYRKIS